MVRDLIPGTSDVQSITSPSPRTLVRGDEPHPSRGAAVKHTMQQNTKVLDQ